MREITGIYRGIMVFIWYADGVLFRRLNAESPLMVMYVVWFNRTGLTNCREISDIWMSYNIGQEIQSQKNRWSRVDGLHSKYGLCAGI